MLVFTRLSIGESFVTSIMSSYFNLSLLPIPSTPDYIQYLHLNHVQAHTFSIKSNLACLAWKPCVSPYHFGWWKSQETKAQDVEKLYEVLEKARSPTGLLTVQFLGPDPFWPWALPCFFWMKNNGEEGRELFCVKHGVSPCRLRVGCFWEPWSGHIVSLEI